MRKGKVYVNDVFAGVLKEIPEGFCFVYDDDYLLNDDALPICLSMPLSQNAYQSKTLFAFFDGLIPEGWLLNIAERNWKLNRRDRMGLLLACCRDCIGNVTVEPFDIEGNE